ncbi:F-box associated interaction domain-containing protein [Artemisia annua]|uniref:F-box associated interaction domain-containing protein n=1 Tax=Artemisia annua TaxID=35608 RepID=A0A2U1MA43_ARTAN|nr:F-box associated interaction domain-containing protein [Artemisia annua]
MACEEGSITIPQDIIIDILHHFPVKSVGRFRCVSKEWLSLLTEPHFIKTHKKTLNNHLIFSSNKYLDDSIYSLPFDNHKGVSTLTKLPIESRTVCIEGSCNGLVLVYAYCHLRDKDTFYVLNPTIKDYVEFSAGRVSDSPFDHYSYGKGLSGVFVNGFLHWIAGKDSDHWVIAAFGLADEKFWEVPLPYVYNDVDVFSYRCYCKLVALGEKLAIFDHVEGVVWLMNEYGVKESWTKIVVHGFSESRMVEPMIFYDNGKIVFVNRKLEVLNHAEEKSLGKSHDVLWLEGTYVESLFLPKIGPTN